MLVCPVSGACNSHTIVIVVVVMVVVVVVVVVAAAAAIVTPPTRTKALRALSFKPPTHALAECGFKEEAHEDLRSCLEPCTSTVG